MYQVHYTWTYGTTVQLGSTPNAPINVVKTLPLEECNGISWMFHNVSTSYARLNSLSSGMFLCFGSRSMWFPWSCSCFPGMVPVQFLCSSTVPGCSSPHCTWRTQLSTSPPPLYRHRPTPFKMLYFKPLSTDDEGSSVGQNSGL